MTPMKTTEEPVQASASGSVDISVIVGLAATRRHIGSS